MGDYAWQRVVSYPSSDTEYTEDTSNFKGFMWEMKCRAKLANIPHIIFEGNPTNYEDWKHEKNKRSYDICITFEDGSKKYYECKFRKEGGKVYPCWVERDWTPRECDVFLTNNTEAIGYDDRRDLEKEGKELSSLEEAFVNITNLAVKIHKKVIGCNQLSSWNSLITYIITRIRARTKEITSKVSILGLKIRLKDSLFKIKSFINARLHRFSYILGNYIGNKKF